jgi:hypothetical protein
MTPAEGSDAVVGGVAQPGAGVVSRPGLFGRLGASARVMVVSAPPGSGTRSLWSRGTRSHSPPPWPAISATGPKPAHDLGVPGARR